MTSSNRWLVVVCLVVGAIAAGRVSAEEDAQVLERLRLYELLRTAPPAPNPVSDRFYTDSETDAPEQRVTVEVDLAMGRETRRPALPLEQLEPLPPDLPFAGTLGLGDGGSWPGHEKVLDIEPTPPTPHPDNTGTPWRTVYKMTMRFNSGGVNYYYSCSGWAAGSFHIVTAGHCVYSWDPNDDGSDADRAWADEIWIWAGQGDVVDPVGDPDVDPDRPFGEAKSVHLRSYSGWTDYQNHNHDWGVITLNRRDGDHSGWLGRESDCADSVNFSGYPTETPYVPTDTVVQYFGYDEDNVDYCWTYRIGLDAYLYGGHSGGPSWRYVAATGERYVEGIHSTSTRTGDAQDTRLTDGKRDDLNAYMASDEGSRPPVARPDLIEYYFDGNTRKELLTNEVVQGEDIEVEYNVFNSGFASSGTFTISFYLSTNNNITTSDHLIGTRSDSLLSSAMVNEVATLTVPTTVPAGQYYVGWIWGGGTTEYSTGNNSAVIGDERVTVTPLRTLEVTSPNGGEVWEVGDSHAITWDSLQAGSAVRIEVTRDGGASWSTVSASTANDGTYTWSVTGPRSSTCRVRLTSVSYPEVGDTSDASFSIVDRQLTVEVPNGGEVWFTATAANMYWSSTDAGATVRIQLSRDSGVTWSTLTASTSNDGNYLWVVSGPVSSDCRIRVTSNSYPAVSDTSDADFGITERRITVSEPNGGETWLFGATGAIRWFTLNAGSTVSVELSRDDGSSWFTLAASTPNDGWYDWPVTLAPSDTCRVRVTSNTYPAVGDTSDGPFSIVQPLFADDFESGDLSAWSDARP